MASLALPALTPSPCQARRRRNWPQRRELLANPIIINASIYPRQATQCRKRNAAPRDPPPEPRGMCVWHHENKRERQPGKLDRKIGVLNRPFVLHGLQPMTPYCNTYYRAIDWFFPPTNLQPARLMIKVPRRPKVTMPTKSENSRLVLGRS